LVTILFVVKWAGHSGSTYIAAVLCANDRKLRI
jgi:hypothetical protein